MSTGSHPGEAADDTEPLLLLASASAGRRRTLQDAGIEHAVLPVDLDEDGILEAARTTAAQAGSVLETAEEVLLLAREKAQAATSRSDGGRVVLGGDSMLELDGEAIGKPHTAERARRRWRAMRGRTAVLHSGHWLIDDRDDADGGTGATLGATASCRIHVAEITDEEIDAYVATGEPLGVAGGFTIDGRAGPFITAIEGDPHAVVGLSLPLLRTLLAEIGIAVHELWADADPSGTVPDPDGAPDAETVATDPAGSASP